MGKQREEPRWNTVREGIKPGVARSLSMSEHQIPLLITARARLDIGGLASAGRVQTRGPKVPVGHELDRLFGDGRWFTVFSRVPELTLTEPMLEPHQGWDDGHDLSHRTSKLRHTGGKDGQINNKPRRLSRRGPYDVLAVVVPTIQNQSDGQKKGIDGTTLDRVPNQPPIKGVHPAVCNKLGRIVGLFDPPDDETGDDKVGGQRHGEEGWGDRFYFQGEGGLTGDEFGEFPDRHPDQCFLIFMD